MGLYDSTGAINGINYASLMNDPYLMMALQSYNPNFKASTSSQVQNNTTSTAMSSNDGSIPVNYAQTKPDTSNTSLWVAGALGAAALIGLGAKGGGNPIKGAKALYERFFKSGGSAASDSVKTALKNLTAVKGPDGKIKFMIPGKTTTLENEEIAKFAKKNGIQDAIISEKQKFTSEVSKIQDFVFGSGTDKYIVSTENGIITGVKDKSGNEILKRLKEAESGHADALRLEGFENIIKELGKTKDIDKSVLNGVTNIRYTNTYGDDVLHMTMAKYGETPELKKFTTLQRFDFNDNEMQALKLASGEKVFADSKFYKDGKLVDGVKVNRFSDEIGGGNIGNFVGENLVSITKPDGTVLPKDSAGYEAIANKYKKDINKLKDKVFVKREYIPKGATLVTA